MKVETTARQKEQDVGLEPLDLGDDESELFTENEQKVHQINVELNRDIEM